MLLSFYPGPAKVYPQVSQYMQEAMQEGILSLNHRSPAFMSLCEATIENCREKLAIPANYTLFFTSSATECWEIIAQSFLQEGDSVLHYYRGAFGEKWADYTEKLCDYASKQVRIFRHEDATSLPTNPTLACFTPNETSNGTAINDSALRKLIKEISPAFVACDVTSSLGGVQLPFKLGDIWFASVQKCLGLPAGMAICIMSPRAVKRAYEIGENARYNSLTNILDNIQKFQTPYTPNILGIYLLNKVMQQVAPIAEVDAMIRRRAKDWYAFLAQYKKYSTHGNFTRSPTVLCVESKPAKIHHLKTEMQNRHIVLGNGYAKGKDNSFRIANFPAITEEEIAVCKANLANLLVSE